MIEEWYCTIPGRPGVKGNSKRILRRGKRTFVASSKKDKAKEDAAAYHIRQQRPATPFDGPVCVNVCFTFAIPKSKARKLSPGDHYTQRPDVENMVKMLHDAMNGTVWNDDSQVVQLFAFKQWGTEDRTAVNVHRAT